jgi:RimJ/RimL family protein N-acetyltransferase
VGLLRAVDDADLDVLFEHWTDAESNRMAAFTVANPHDRQAFEERWARLRNDPSVRARTIDVDGTVVGSVSSWDHDGTREVTYWLGREHWGKGLATRALAEFLELVERKRPVQAAAAFDNVGSQRVLEKCGFRRSGEGRGFANGRGAEVDEVLFRLDA